MNHYFSDSPEVASNVREYKIEILGNKYSFYTDNGVFSKDHLDFGSELLIESFINQNFEGKIADLGSGIGVIGITLAHKYNRQLLMIEVNQRAADLSKRNAVLNKVDATILNQSIEKNIAEKAAVCVTNPPIRAGKKIVFLFFEKAYDLLLPNGELWVVIRKQQGAQSAVEEIKRIFQNCEIVKKKKGFFILRAIKSL